MPHLSTQRIVSLEEDRAELKRLERQMAAWQAPYLRMSEGVVRRVELVKAMKVAV